MLFKFLDQIRSKPKHVREQYALGIAVFCTVAIGGVWSLSLPARFASETQVAGAATSSNTAPFSNFFTQLKQQFTSVKQEVEELKIASTTGPVSVASSTEAALEMQITPENMEQIKDNEVTASSTEFQYGGMQATGTSVTQPKPILIGTTSAATASGTAR